MAQKPHTHSSEPLSESRRYVVKLARRLQTIVFHDNDLSRNKGDYTLIKQWNYAGNHDNGWKFNNILYSWKVFFFFLLLPERLGKLWERTEKHLCLIWTIIPLRMSWVCSAHSNVNFTATWNAPPGSWLHIYLEKGTKQGVSSSISSNDTGQQTVSPIQVQFYLFFKIHFSFWILSETNGLSLVFCLRKFLKVLKYLSQISEYFKERHII